MDISIAVMAHGTIREAEHSQIVGTNLSKATMPVTIHERVGMLRE
jgi:hypothetical protein